MAWTGFPASCAENLAEENSADDRVECHIE